MGYVILLTHYGKLWDSIQTFPESQDKYSVSIIIAFRDEEKSLPQLLESMQALKLAQVKAKVFFVDDHSVINRFNILKTFH